MNKENQAVEWKESWRDEYLKWICGFANAEGGTLVIGKNDNGNAVVLSNIEKLLEDIPNKIKDVLGVMANVSLVKDSGKELIEIKVEPSSSPVSYKGAFYYRSGSTKQELKGSALSHFLLEKQGRTWDSVAVRDIKINSLSKGAISLFKKMAKQSQRINKGILNESMSSLMDKLDLVEKSYIKRAAVLMFCSNPEKFIAGSFVKIGFFQNESELLYHDEIKGDLFNQSQKTLEVLFSKYLKAAINYHGIQRIESYPVPDDALREAVLNAIIHRDYSVNTPIQIRIYNDRISVCNPCELPDKWTVEKLLKKHSSRPFNPLIANAFFRAGLIEAWGRGIQRMFDSCKNAGTPKPRIIYEEGDLWVEFRFSLSYLRIIAALPNNRKLDEKLDEKLSSVRIKIIRLMYKNPMITVTELAQILEISRTAIDKNIQILKSKGYVSRIGGAKGGRWEIIEKT